MSRVAVVGASAKPERYSNRALRMLQSAGHTPIPVSRGGQDILGLPGYPTVSAIPDPVDTISMYLSPEKQGPVIRDILAGSKLNPAAATIVSDNSGGFTGQPATMTVTYPYQLRVIKALLGWTGQTGNLNIRTTFVMRNE